jgi:hypothetical protein
LKKKKNLAIRNASMFFGIQTTRDPTVRHHRQRDTIERKKKAVQQMLLAVGKNKGARALAVSGGFY